MQLLPCKSIKPLKHKQAVQSDHGYSTTTNMLFEFVEKSHTYCIFHCRATLSQLWWGEDASQGSVAGTQIPLWPQHICSSYSLAGSKIKSGETLAGEIKNNDNKKVAMQFKSRPVNPAPAAPNREAMMAMPVAEPRAAAPPAPSTAVAPAATSGAASPPVTPSTGTEMLRDQTFNSPDVNQQSRNNN